MWQWGGKIQGNGGERRKRGRVTDREKQYYLVRWLYALWGATFLLDCSDQRRNAFKCIHTAPCTYRLDFSLSSVWAPGDCLSRASSLTCCAKIAHNTHLFNDSMNEWMNEQQSGSYKKILWDQEIVPWTATLLIGRKITLCPIMYLFHVFLLYFFSPFAQIK